MVTLLPLTAMPNGGGYRSTTPSPIHTSDSDVTWGRKHAYQLWARVVFVRWRQLVFRRRLHRLSRYLDAALGRRLPRPVVVCLSDMLHDPEGFDLPRQSVQQG